MAYTYEALDPLRREIRLVRLHPGTQKGKEPEHQAAADLEISVSVIKASLDEDVEYTAMSYVWGDATTKVEIQVDGHPFQVTKNLAAALQRLRHDKDDLTLWIDAICIQQSDNDEKSWQIQLMKDIYEKVTRTIVWLGEEDDNAVLIMAICSQLAAQAAPMGLSLLRAPEVTSWIKENLASPETPMFASGQAALKKLLAREYWFRTWCLQEFCVSREIAVACGAHTVDFEVFRVLVELLVHSYSRAWYQSVSHQDLLTAKNNNPEAYKPENTAGVIHGATRMFQQREKFRHSLESPGQSSAGLLLSDLLISAFTHEAADISLRSTDPRDRVFGLLNLASDAKELGIRPDYNKACEDVYTETWAAILARGQASLLVHSQYGRPRGDAGAGGAGPAETSVTYGMHGEARPHLTNADGRELPSWVPDWRIIRDPSPGNRPIDRPYTACGDKTTTEWIVTDQVREIALKGVEVDTIDKVGTVLETLNNWTTNTQLSSLAGFLDEIAAFVIESSTKNPEGPLSDETVMTEAMWRIPVADRESIAADGGYRRATPESAERYESVRRVIEDWNKARMSDNPTAAVTAMAMTILQSMGKFDLYMGLVMMYAGWRPFLTSQGCVGLGPADMEVDDVVAIFYGSHVPFVLRPGEGEFQLMGEAYVHGIMDGEFMEEEREELSFYIN